MQMALKDPVVSSRLRRFSAFNRFFATCSEPAAHRDPARWSGQGCVASPVEETSVAFVNILAAATLALALAAPVVAADNLNPVGNWRTTTGESRYKVSLCGDGTQLCAKLIWLREDARTPENMKLLNSYVVQGAREVRENNWTGTVKYDGQTVDGSVTMVSRNQMQFSGCKLIACKQVDFVRM